MSTSSRGALAPGRFRLLLLALVLFIVGTAVLAGGRLARLLEFVLLAIAIVVALLELRVRGESRLVSIALAACVIFVAVVDHTARLRHVPIIASALVAVFAGLVVWLAYAAVVRAGPSGERPDRRPRC